MKNNIGFLDTFAPMLPKSGLCRLTLITLYNIIMLAITLASVSFAMHYGFIMASKVAS